MNRESELFARWLGVGMALGFSALLVSFALYVTGLLPASIPPGQLPRYWSLPVADYLKATGAPTGWSWVGRLSQADVLNFLGLAILAATPIAAYVRLAAHFARTGERLALAICVAEVAVLAAAAAGLIG
jgi:hypothetical protein